MVSKKNKILELLNQGINDVSTLAEKSEASLGYARSIASEYERKRYEEGRKRLKKD
jgi:hypothetical protein